MTGKWSVVALGAVIAVACQDQGFDPSSPAPIPAHLRQAPAPTAPVAAPEPEPARPSAEPQVTVVDWGDDPPRDAGAPGAEPTRRAKASPKPNAAPARRRKK